MVRADETGVMRPYGLEEMSVTATRRDRHAAPPQSEEGRVRHGRRMPAVAAAIVLAGLAVLAATLILAGNEPARPPVFVPAASAAPARSAATRMPGMPGMKVSPAHPRLRTQAARYGIVSGP